MRIVGLADVRQIQSLRIQAMKVVIGDVARAGMIRHACKLQTERERGILGETTITQATGRPSSRATHHIHLPHRVDKYDGEYCDGHAQAKALRYVPDDPLEPHGQQQHQYGTDPDEGGQEEEQQYESTRQCCDLQRRAQDQQQQGTSHCCGEAQIEILVIFALLIALPKAQRQTIHMLRLVAVHGACIDRLREESIHSIRRLMMCRHRVTLAERTLKLVRDLRL